MQSRAGRTLEGWFPDVAAALSAFLPVGTVLDGELVVFDPTRGRTSFPLLGRRATAGRDIARVAGRHPAQLVAFDLLQLAGVDVRPWPLLERRAALEELSMGAPPGVGLCPATHDRREAVAWMRTGADVGIEGVVVKDLADPYRPGRTRWRKVKIRATSEAIIGGVTGPVTAPAGLMLGRYDTDGKFRYAARTGPLSAAHRGELGALLPAAVWKSGGWEHPWPQPMPARWMGQFGTREPVVYTQLEPVFVVEIAADPAEECGRSRHNVRLLRLRPEIPPEELPPMRPMGGPYD